MQLAYKIVCLDGAINRIKRYLEITNSALQRSPDFIIGDLDSIKPESINWLNQQFGDKAYEIHHFNSQTNTDFEKSLNFISDLTGDWSEVSVVALNCFGGRLDHTLAILNSTVKFPRLQIQLMNESCLARIISSKRAIIEFNGFKDKSCGILPLFGPVKLWSSGLKWNLESTQILQFSGSISTSNQIISDKVEIENYTNVPFIWTHELDI